MKTIRLLASCVLMLLLINSPTTGAAESALFATAPVKNGDQRWRIAYYEGGPYIDYQKILTETIRGLMQLGWIEKATIPAQEGEQTEQLWHWLTTEARSDYIEFVKDGHYSAGWDDQLREETAGAVIQRLQQNDDIDLMIAMGTWAGKDLANDQQSTPTMVLSASNPISAGIIKSVDDSGFAHLHASVDPGRHDRQIRIFYDVVGFRKLGVAYEDSVNGRSYAAMDELMKLSKKKGFELVGCHTKSDISDIAIAEESVKDCFNRLVEQVDAIYVTQQGGVNSNSIPELVAIANQHRIPTFSQSGSDEVKLGFLLSLSQAGFRYVGEFHAETFARVFNGAEPGQLEQLFEEPPKLAVNLKTAELVEFDPPLLLLGATDEIYKEIQNPQR